MIDRPNGIDIFVHAAQAGSFAAAAQRLGLTRSAVAKNIARLEARLNSRLFHRTTRRQALTEEGQSYYEGCLRALAELEGVERMLSDGKQEPQGRLRVTAPVLFGRHCVAPALVTLASRYPGLELQMSFSDKVHNLAQDGYDLAVRVGPLPDTTQLVARRVGMQQMVVCAAPSYLATHGRPVTLEDLRAHQAIFYSIDGRAYPWKLYDADGQATEPELSGRLLLDDMDAIADAAVAGHGLAWLPCWLCGPHVRAGRLEIVMQRERVVATPIHLVWPHSRYLASRTRAAIDVLARELPALLP